MITGLCDNHDFLLKYKKNQKKKPIGQSFTVIMFCPQGTALVLLAILELVFLTVMEQVC